MLCKNGRADPVIDYPVDHQMPNQVHFRHVNHQAWAIRQKTLQILFLMAAILFSIYYRHVKRADEL